MTWTDDTIFPARKENNMGNKLKKHARKLKKHAYKGAVRLAATDIVGLVKVQAIPRITNDPRVKEALETDAGDGLLRLAIASALAVAPSNDYVDDLRNELYTSAATRGLEALQGTVVELVGVAGLLGNVRP